MKSNPNTQRVASAAAATVKFQRELIGSEELYRSVRAGLTLYGFTFTSYCQSQGIDRAWGRLVLLGKSNGPKGRALRMQLARAAGLL